jgi:putative acetyltransferase
MRARADVTDVNLHYFLRPDHHDAGRIFAATSAIVLPETALDDSRAWLFDRIESLHDSGAKTICALDARTGHMRGFVTVHPDTKRLHQIVVAPEALGSGLASILLAEARDIAPARMEVLVSADNARALRFFEREGFVRRGASDVGDVLLEWRA